MEHVFQWAILLDGEVFEVEEDMYLEFLVDDEGAVMGFELRGLEDLLTGSARRVR